MAEIREFASWHEGEMQVRKWVPLDAYAKLVDDLTARQLEIAQLCYENQQLRLRCWALATLTYPLGAAPREAVAGDLGYFVLTMDKS